MNYIKEESVTEPTPAQPAPAKRSWLRKLIPSASFVAAAAALATAFMMYFGIKTYDLVAQGTIRPAYQAVCLEYSNFVLTQAHNGYTPEQIQRVIDFAGSHPISPNPAHPDNKLAMPNRWPSISDSKACGTPAEIIAKANGK